MSKSINFIKEITKINKEQEIIETTFKDSINFSVKQFLPVELKMEFVELLISNCFSEDEDRNVKYYNPLLYEMMYGYLILKYYTNLNISSSDVTNIYNVAKQSGLIEFVKNHIDSEELLFLNECITERIDEEYSIIEREQQFGNVLSKFLNDINKSLPLMMERLKDFDPKKLDFLNEYKNILNTNKKGDLQ